MRKRSFLQLRFFLFQIASRDLSPCDVVTDTELFVDGKRASGWRFEETLLDEDHCVCTAVNGGRSCSNPTGRRRETKTFQLIEGIESVLGETEPSAFPRDWEDEREWECAEAMVKHKPF